MKKVLNLMLALAIAGSVSSPLYAKPKGKPAPVPPPAVSVETQWVGGAFNLEPARMSYFSQFNFRADELGLVLYFYSVSGRPVNQAELTYIAQNRNWNQLAWYFGLPPILFEDGVFTFRHPERVRHYPPLGKSEYKYEVKGKTEEKVELTKDKYEYKYRNKPLGIEEKLEITKDKYSYSYKDRTSEEKLEIKYPSYAYEYKYKDRKTGQEIKKEGTGKPITPTIFYPELKKEREVRPTFQFTLHLDFNL